MRALVVLSCFVALVVGQHPAHLDFDVNVEIGKLHDIIAAQRRQHEEPVQVLHQEPEPLPLDNELAPIPEVAIEPTLAPVPVQTNPIRRRTGGLRRRRPQGGRPVLRRRPVAVEEPRPASPQAIVPAPVVQDVAQFIAPEPTFRAQAPTPVSGNVQTIDYHPTFRQQLSFVDEQQQHRFAAIAQAPEPLPVGSGATHDENGLLINPRGYDGPLAHTVPAGLGGTIHTQFTPEVAAFHKFLAQAHADHLAQVAGLDRRQFSQ